MLILLSQALLEAPDIQLGETGGFELAVALGFSIYSLNKTKKMTIGEQTVVRQPKFVFGNC